MTSVPQVAEQHEDGFMEERAKELAGKQAVSNGCASSVAQTCCKRLVFGWQQHPDASLEQLASTAELRDGVSVRHRRSQALHAAVCRLLACGLRGDEQRGRPSGPRRADQVAAAL